MHMHADTCMHMHTHHVNVNVNVHACVCMPVCMCMCACAYLCACVCVHTPQSFHDVYFHGNTETGQLRSLWLCQIDPRIALVLIFAERKRAKDSSVLAFLRQICEGLRGQGILEHSLLQ